MATIQITVSDSEKKNIEQLFNSMGFTVSSATKVFYKQALNDNGFPFTPKLSIKQTSKVIRPKISSTGALIIPDDAPQDIKDWVKNG
ncbi:MULTISPECIES: type II toxin-antitoxin system RelB/DinJ family antitoxin [Bacilli]|uniref:Type II toxin-antitoxin system RelB/DinJ family antitoxin n=1 Tax=Lactobacillus johnsonii TaxID=33959 RepID=A0A9X7TBE0_LACJH|nr:MULTISPECIES: type II toxin-antitoxin system RelB/DinJ family antitoxin [Bacilli]QIA88570.1 hypothetical protein FEE39_10025 [Lactobacillus johnsonii]QIA88577.1 hypothetical protein FEE39_10060 [Lactobacillus johnsonii]